MKFCIKTMFLFFIFSIFPICKCYCTQSIKKIDVEILIDDNNNLEITEYWEGSFNNYSELYHYYEGLKKNEISDYFIIENGIKYEISDDWEVAVNNDIKKQKCYINETIDGVELIWGIGDYGYHKYKIKYKLLNCFNNKELDLNLFNFDYFFPETLNIKVKGNFSNNIFAKINVENCDLKRLDGEVDFKLNGNINNVSLYLNYDGVDNSIKKDDLIKINALKNKKLFVLKRCIVLLLFLIIMILIIIKLMSKKKLKYEFRSF